MVLSAQFYKNCNKIFKLIHHCFNFPLQFKALKDGDRFFFTHRDGFFFNPNPFTSEQLENLKVYSTFHSIGKKVTFKKSTFKFKRNHENHCFEIKVYEEPLVREFDSF